MVPQPRALVGPVAAARHNVVRDAAPPPLPPLPPRVADPGMTEESIRKGTGKGWDEWFRILDAWDGTAHARTEIAPLRQWRARHRWPGGRRG